MKKSDRATLSAVASGLRALTEDMNDTLERLKPIHAGGEKRVCNLEEDYGEELAPFVGRLADLANVTRLASLERSRFAKHLQYAVADLEHWIARASKKPFAQVHDDVLQTANARVAGVTR